MIRFVNNNSDPFSFCTTIGTSASSTKERGNTTALERRIEKEMMVFCFFQIFPHASTGKKCAGAD